MRAKEYFELIDKKDFQYIEETKQALDDLYQIRTDFAETKKYINSKLDPENNQHPDKYLIIRGQLCQLVEQDKTFDYFYSEASFFQSITPLRADKVTIEEIKEDFKIYKEDYPKTSVDEYLQDSFNLQFYTKMQGQPDITYQDWLEIFNTGYYLFDEIRAKMNLTAIASDFLKEYRFDNKKIHKHTIFLVIALLENYNYDFTKEQETKKKDLIKVLKNHYENNPNAFEKTTISNFRLVNKKGIKTDYFKVMDALYEDGMYETIDGKELTKQDMIRAFETILNDDFKDYHNLVSSGRKSQNYDGNSKLTTVFDRLKAITIEKAKKKNYNENT